MRKLIQGIVDFREHLKPSYQETFERLALGQKPDVLFVGCSDSRVVPNLFASTEPGDLFVIRNVGNLIAPCDVTSSQNVREHAEAAAIEYAVLQLGVADIVICGHSECGATLAVLDETRTLSPNLTCWLENLHPSVVRMKNGDVLDSTLSPHNQLSQINVLQQLEHLATYPVVQEALHAGKLRLHAWWFNIAKVEVEIYDPTIKKFRPIDKKMAERLLQTMDSTDTVTKREMSSPFTDFMSWKPCWDKLSKARPFDLNALIADPTH
ncbi:MAG: carbonic anhydrase [Proteobacteria bacterium]|nr:MAG: carbonic anhydrase [Pseudomonadota bacterium]